MENNFNQPDVETETKPACDYITCKQCGFWRNNQSVLDFMNHTGICINPKFKYNTTNGITVGVLDMENIGSGISNPVKEFNEQGHESRYLLATSDNFGCRFGEVVHN